jgi:hypothetical protein
MAAPLLPELILESVKRFSKRMGDPRLNRRKGSTTRGTI